MQRALAALLERLREDVRDDDDVRYLQSVASDNVYNVVHLIYRARNYEGHSKDYEFSRRSMQDHWRAGYHDAQRTLRHPGGCDPPLEHGEGVSTFDLERDGRE